MGNRILLCIALCTALLLVACGGSGEGPAAEPAKAAATGFTGNGTYWNPAQPGTGFVFEAQGDTGIVTFFVFDAHKKPVWYTASGPFTLVANTYSFSGELLMYSGGQSAGMASPRTPTSTPVGPVQIGFSGGRATVGLRGRTFEALRYFAPTPAEPLQPVTGIYWNPAESGRGYTIEVSNSIAMIGVFHYNADGSPTWNLVVGNIKTGAVTAAMNAYSGGQTLTGTFVATQAEPSAGPFSAIFGDTCKGQVKFPNMSLTPVERFSFGGLGDLCAKPAPVPAATSADKCPATATLREGRSTQLGSSVYLTNNGYAGLQFTAPTQLVEWSVCLFAVRAANKALMPAPVQELATDWEPENYYGIFTSGEFAALGPKSLYLARWWPVSTDIQGMSVIAYTQDAQGAWKREALPTTTTESPSQVVPSNKYSTFGASVSKPGFYTVGYP